MSRVGNPETPIVKAIREAVNKSGMAIVHRNNVNVRGKVKYGLGDGSPDLVGIYTYPLFPLCMGVFVGIEVKVPGKELSEVQTKWHADATWCGALMVCAHSPQEAIDFLRNPLARTGGIRPAELRPLVKTRLRLVRS